MTSATVQITDRGYSRLMARLGRLAGANQVTVGIHEEDGAEDHVGGEGLSVADVGIIHERGGGNVPRRSWLEDTITLGQREIKRFAKARYERVVKGQLRAPVALDRFGLFVVGLIQQRIAGGIPPENADSTIAAKGSSTPLIDKGQLRASISHKVRRPGEEVRS